MRKEKHWFESWAHLEPYLRKRPRGFEADPNIFGQKLLKDAKCGSNCDNHIQGIIYLKFLFFVSTFKYACCSNFVLTYLTRS